MTMTKVPKSRGGGAHRTGQPAMELIQRIGDENRERELREADTEIIPVIEDFRADRHVVEALRDRFVDWALDAQMDHKPCGFCSLVGYEVDFRVWGEDVQAVCRPCLPHAIARDWTEGPVQIEYSPRMASLLERMTGHGHRVSGVLDVPRQAADEAGEVATDE
ncbi:hypothetical protein [Prauserella muralis]|uniref:Uncharacterized protein n=1 Tax=Prauserella muralis TaxID=588067 RepID=A0A2V4AZV2_9PSEU|nr:hypothetical protein [Prauserella muralis]PXY27402.1 hypothetical protein BAY60_13285 [Prauserella muralis]TWE22902.1 hypothetical protein FHX69_4158 [Prauserella muralis]